LLATGTAWYYSARAVTEWRFLNDNPDGIETLLFGDFDGDGRTDVLGKNGLDLVASWGGASEWEKVNEIDAPLSALAVGNFDNSDRADIFYADGATWFVAYNNGPFVATQTSSFRVNELRFGDFDGDGRTDVLGVVNNAWRVSYAATSSWSFLRSKLTDTVDRLLIADFDGNSHADVATVSVQALNDATSLYRWRISIDGVGNWIDLTPTTKFVPAAIGRFVADDPRAGVLVWRGYTLWRATLGESLSRQSRQDMR
jgi:hypothetical protein